MARQDDSVTIDGKKYHFTQLDPRRAARVYAFLVNRVGGGIAKAIGAIKPGKGGGVKGLMDGDMDMAALGDALQDVLSSLDDDKAMAHVDTLLSCVLFGNENLSLDHPNFQGKMKHLTKVVYKSVEVNFSDFLGESSGLVAKLKRSLSTIQGQAMSTGSSGDPSSQG